jgi:uncharacterized repeat protein (TIGR03803 family)
MYQASVERIKLVMKIQNLFCALACAGFITSTAAQTFTNLYDFGNGTGANPFAGMVLSGVTLYGTTTGGGDSGNGAIYRINTDGTDFTNLHSFTHVSSFTNSDGIDPKSTVVLSGNTLYGTALAGGPSGSGIIFSMSADGSNFTNLYSFSHASSNIGGTNVDGEGPQTLTLSGNTLYGTTLFGGTNGTGTIFAVETDGTRFTNLYIFSTANGFFINPNGGLILYSNTLYGTTENGGISNAGTVFKINTDSSGFTNIYNFTGGSDGKTPFAGLVLSATKLYGTTEGGGISNAGTVFKINADGSGFTNLYSFSGGADGAFPLDNLTLSGNTLYGTTSRGGSGQGTVFAIQNDGLDFTNLFIFPFYLQGSLPYAGLILSSNVLYGTTYSGGALFNGTVFALSLPVILPSLSVIYSNSSLVISWPSPSTGFVLQQNSVLSTTNWAAVDATADDDGTNKSIVISSPVETGFFRLQHP